MKLWLSSQRCSSPRLKVIVLESRLHEVFRPGRKFGRDLPDAQITRCAWPVSGARKTQRNGRGYESNSRCFSSERPLRTKPASARKLAEIESMSGVVSATPNEVRFCRICHEEQPATSREAEESLARHSDGFQSHSAVHGSAFFRGLVVLLKHAHGRLLRVIFGLVRRLKQLRRRFWPSFRDSIAETKDATRCCAEGDTETRLRRLDRNGTMSDALLSDPKTLIAPCRCSGTLKYVHQGCLRKWLRRQPDPSCWHCEICGHFYSSEVHFRPAYEFLFRWPLGQDKAAWGDLDDMSDESWLVSFSDWEDPSSHVLALNSDWGVPAEASQDRTPSFVAWLLRGWQSMTNGQRRDSAVASRWLHWLHILYIGLFTRHIFRQAKELTRLVKQTANLEPLPRALCRGGHAVRTIVEANALVALRTALIAHYLIFLAVDVRFLYRQFKLWRAATARILILNCEERETTS